MAGTPDKVLSRDFTIEVFDDPTWLAVGGLYEDGITISKSEREADFMDADDGGMAKPVTIGRGYEVTLKGARMEDTADGSRDVGQAFIESYADAVGLDALIDFRITSPATGGEVISFSAWVSTTEFGGGEKAGWEAKLKVYGPITRT